MITSMTGYGDAQGTLEGLELALEIRCLNNRYYKPSVRLPDELSYLEPTVDSLLRKAVSRGALVYTLRVKPAEEAALVEINHKALRSFVHDLRELERDPESPALLCQNYCRHWLPEHNAHPPRIYGSYPRASSKGRVPP